MKQVKICLGRFQPFTLGHLKMATHKKLNGPERSFADTLTEQPDLKKIAEQKTVILVVSTPSEKVDSRHPFSDDLMEKEFDIIKNKYKNDIEDILYVKSADICAWGELIKKHGYQASVWLTGADEYEFYKSMALKVPEYVIKNRNNYDCAGAYTSSFYVERIERNDKSDDFVSTISGTKVRRSLIDNDMDVFKSMMPDGVDRFFNEFREAIVNVPERKKSTSRRGRTLSEYLNDNILKHSLIQYIKEQRINEGGNAVTANPIPAFIAPRVYEEIENIVREKYPKIEICPLGSLGKKSDDQTNGDIDVAIRVDTKQELNDIIDECFPDSEKNFNTLNTISSFGYKYDIDGYKGIAQVDFMLTKRIDWAKFRFHSPNLKTGESKYKGAVRTLFLVDIISCIPVKNARDEYFEDGVTVKRKWKYTFNTEGVFLQLVDFCGRNGRPVKNGKKLKEFEKLITNDPGNVIKFIFGNEGDMNDTNSPESMWAAIHDKKKFTWGDDVLGAIEKKIYNDSELKKLNVDFNDFPCELYYEQ